MISFECVDYSSFQMYIWEMLLRCWLGAQKQALTKLALQVKIYVMKMSDPCWAYMHICAVGFLNVYTCTTYCISMHLTAFHRSENGDQTV